MAQKAEIDWTQARKLGLILLLPVAVLTTCAISLSGDDPAPPAASTTRPDRTSGCPADATITGVEYRPVRAVELHATWELADKLINEKATKIMGRQHYQTADGSTKVFEKCVYNDSALVMLLEPEWLKGREGWAAEVSLKEKKNPDDPYEGKIASYIFDPTTDHDYSGPSRAYKHRRHEIDQLLIAAAKKAADSGKCDYVEGSMFSPTKSQPDNLVAVVDCSPDTRFVIANSELTSTTTLLSETEKSLPPSIAARGCRALIMERYRAADGVKFPGRSGAGYYQAPVTGNVVYQLAFEAKMPGRAWQRMQARCVFDTNGVGELSVRD